MTDEHVWVTLDNGKRLYVGKSLEPAKPTLGNVAIADTFKPKRKRSPSPTPVETSHAD